MTNAPKYEPVLTPQAKAWLDGEMSSEDYFAWARERARRNSPSHPVGLQEEKK